MLTAHSSESLCIYLYCLGLDDLTSLVTVHQASSQDAIQTVIGLYVVAADCSRSDAVLQRQGARVYRADGSSQCNTGIIHDPAACAGAADCTGLCA